MYCRNCGNEIPKNARFCTICGTEVVAPKDQRASSPSLSAGNEQVNAAQAEMGVAPQTAQVQFADNEEVAQANNLKAAVESGKRRSRRPIPMILLVALALALATSVAYAAYRVYTDVWVPYQAEQQQGQQNQNTSNDAQNQTYTVDTVSVDVSAPANIYSNPGERENDTWTYPQIKSSVQSEAVDSINQQLKEKIETEADRTSKYPSDKETIESNLDEYAACVLTEGIEVTYISDEIVCVRDAGYATGWGAHGWHFSNGQTYSLKTGELIDPLTVFDMSKDDAISATKKAARVYFSSNDKAKQLDGDWAEQAMDDIETDISEAYKTNQTNPESKCPFVITDKGLVYMSHDYEFGPYAYGTPSILVASFDGSTPIGTEINFSANEASTTEGN